MEFRKGDVVKFEGVVAFATAGQVYFEGSNTASLPVGQVELVRRAFKAGERVRYVPAEAPFDGNVVGNIVGIHGEWVWIDDGTGYMHTAPAADCRPESEPVKPPTVIPGGNGTWVAPPPNPEDPPPMLAEARIGEHLFGEVPKDEGCGAEITYTTAVGDTLAAMAHVFETSVDTIRALNGGAATDAIPATLPLPVGLALKVKDNRLPF